MNIDCFKLIMCRFIDTVNCDFNSYSYLYAYLACTPEFPGSLSDKVRFLGRNISSLLNLRKRRRNFTLLLDIRGKGGRVFRTFWFARVPPKALLLLKGAARPLKVAISSAKALCYYPKTTKRQCSQCPWYTAIEWKVRGDLHFINWNWVPNFENCYEKKKKNRCAAGEILF